MASCSLGTSSNVKLLDLDFVRKGFGVSQQYGTRSCTCRRPLQYAGLLKSQQRNKFLTTCSSLETQSVTKFEDGSEEIGTSNLTSGITAITKSEDGSEEIRSSTLTSDLTAITKSDDGSEEIRYSTLTNEFFPNFNEVKFLLKEVCETSSIAELDLKIGGFRLHVVRDLTEKIRTPPPPAPTSVSESTAPDSNESVSTSSLAISKPVSSPGGIQRLLFKAADEGLVIIQSPRVGFFRRSRTIKGKRAPPSCKETQIVKEGQVICYIEQLGGELPIESDVAGEVIKILREDGDPVGYGDALVAVLPSFSGIKKLQ